MSDSDDPVSAVVTHEKRRRQETESDSENDFMVFKEYKRKGAELIARLRQMSSDSEEDNDVKPVKKRQKLLYDKESCSKKQDMLGSLTAEKDKLGKEFSSATKEDKNKVLKRQVELRGYEDSNTEIIATEEEESDTEKLRAKHLVQTKKFHDRNCSSNDSVDYVFCDGVTRTSPAKQESRRQSGNVSDDDDENSVQTSLSKQSVQIHVKKSVDKPKSSKISMLKEELTSSESKDETFDVSKCVLETVNNKEKQQNTKTEVKDGREAASDSDSVVEEPLKTVAKKRAKQRDSSAGSDGENNKERQQNTKTEVKDGREAASDSDSVVEEPLKTVAKKRAKQRDSSAGSDSENNKEKQQNTKREVKDGRAAVSESDSMDEEPLKTVAKKRAKQRDSSAGSDGENNKERQQNTKTEVKDGRAATSDSDSVEEEPLKTAVRKRAKQRDSSPGSDSENNKEKQQNTKREVKDGRAAASDSDSVEEEPLKTVVRKRAKQRDSFPGAQRQNYKERHQNTKIKVKDGRAAASDSDSMDEEPLKTVAKKRAKQRDNSAGSDKERHQKTKIKMKDGGEAAFVSDSVEEEPLKTVQKKSAEYRVSYPDSRKEGRTRKQQKAKTKMRDGIGKDSDSDSEDEKPLNTVSTKLASRHTTGDSSTEESKRKWQKKTKVEIIRKRDSVSELDSEDEKPLNSTSEKTVRQRDDLNDTSRESSKKRQQSVTTKINRREGKVYDSDSEGEVSTEDSVTGKLRKLTKRSESHSEKDSKLNKSKPKIQKEIGTCSSDSDDDGPLKMLAERTEIKQIRKKQQGKETNGKKSDFDMEAEKPLNTSRQELHTSSDSSGMTFDQSVRQKKSQKNHKKGKAEKTELTMSDSAEESDVSAGNRKSTKTVKKKNRGSSSDVASDALTKVRVSNAVKGIKGKQSTEGSTDSSDVDECRFKKKNSESKTSYHSMSSTESEDTVAGSKMRKLEAIKKASTKNKAHKSSDSSSDSSDSDDKNFRKDKQEKGKKAATENKRVTSLKRYLRVAGIHTVTYSKVLQNCRSNKAKIEGLLDLLRKEGLKGKPSVQKCKRLRKKIETRREVQELDVANIMEEKGRPQRSSRSNCTKNQSENYKHDAKEKAASIKQKFSRIRDIIDSESD